MREAGEKATQREVYTVNEEEKMIKIIPFYVEYETYMLVLTYFPHDLFFFWKGLEPEVLLLR